jgi:hypothetical protein
MKRAISHRQLRLRSLLECGSKIHHPRSDQIGGAIPGTILLAGVDQLSNAGIEDGRE